MDAVSAEEFLKDQVPAAVRALIVPTLKTAYEAAQLMAKGEPILNVQSARDNRGRLISWAVDFGIEQLLKTQRWPYEYRWRDFAQPTGRYLEIRLSHAVLTISQVANPGKQPRNVVFRENGRLSNAPFFDLSEFDDTRAVQGVPHFLLIHGHKNLEFAHLAVPHAVYRRDWIYKTPNLLTLPHVVPETVPPTEATEFNTALALKEEIEKWRKDNDVS
ncbi:hypothetical protein [Methylobacterium sp. ARG-1]|uniref:hypothetical protein n=1 Tax=Methylobacterium sp. ARG-1 TaxID=1692501 RepID=UPI000681FD65|nr:hypothetical protein [Methylobacterium sp. ARG-1]KNY21633.1 hypothetical protein AKJ13_15405 [Methylobacterium sp. ARG-1]